MDEDKADISRAAEKRCFTVAEFTAAHGISRTRLYGEIKSGRLIARRLGGRTIIARSDADAWIAALPAHQPCSLVKRRDV